MLRLLVLLLIGMLVAGQVTAQVAAQEATPPLSPDAPQPGSDGAGDSFYDQLGNGGYDVLHYTLDLSVDMDTNTIDATATIDAQATQALSAFNLDFSGLTVTAVTVDGVDAAFTHTGRELTITPQTPLDNGEAFTTTVAYEGRPRSAIDRSLQAPIGWNYRNGGVYVASEVAGAATWYPVNDHPSDKATYTIRVTVEAPYVVAANGVLVDTIENDDQITYVWQVDQPMASYLATVSINDFEIQTDESAGGVPIRNYFPASIADDGETAFALQPNMLDYFESVFGEYPFDEYGVIVINGDMGFALETQTRSLFGRSIVNGAVVGDAGSLTVIAHELAHQWFGDSLTLSDWSDIWLNEGFATYASWLWYDHFSESQTIDDIVISYYDYISGNDLYRDDAPDAQLLARITSVTPPGAPTPNRLFNPGVYYRGALTLHALRLAVGDDAFFAILRAYYERFRDGNVSTADFIAVAEDVSGQPLDDLFDAWLYDERIPDIPELGLSRLF